MNVLVNVVNQKLRIATNLKNMVAGTQEFIKFTFHTDGDWDDLLIFAQFIQDGVAYSKYLDENNSVYLPAEIAPGRMYMILYGTGGNTIATTNYVSFVVKDNHYIYDERSTDIPLSLYQQFVGMVESMYDEKTGMVNLLENPDEQDPKVTLSLYQQLVNMVRSITIDDEGIINFPNIQGGGQ